jgi:Immunity protein Imm1
VELLQRVGQIRPWRRGGFASGSRGRVRPKRSRSGCGYWPTVGQAFSLTRRSNQSDPSPSRWGDVATPASEAPAEPVLATPSYPRSAWGRPSPTLRVRISSSGDTPYLSSTGDLIGDDLVVFRFMGDSSEFPIRHAIPIESAREAIRHFFRTGQLPDTIKWEEA